MLRVLPIADDAFCRGVWELHALMFGLRGIATAPHQQQVSCVFHKLGVSRVGLLQAREVTGELELDMKGYRIPSAVRDEPVMEDVEATQIFDDELASEAIFQFTGGKEVKSCRNTTSVGELDVVSVQSVIKFKVTCLLNRIDEDGRSTAD
jgi:hypothetical protein